jgi:hypothetical protein
MTQEAKSTGKKMKKYTLTLICLVMAITGVSNFAFAEQNGSYIDAHVHGLSELTIAIEGERVEMQLKSPAMNLVGFEHKASSKKDIAAIQQAELKLRQQDALFLISGADCQHISSVIDTTNLIDADDHKQQDDHHDHHHDHHSESHKETHDNDKHEDSESHSELIANYSYHCNKDSKLSSITLSLFKAFPGIHKVHAMWVTPIKQGSIMVSKNSPMIKFED